ncbi:hypothetical protein BD770DRAFT_400941 [Pilaira anomala]|nr:hypothetical protein BD770DRAFT_400941 [Pilaira anomala]
MFRTTSNQLVRSSPLWRNASVCSSLKNYSTPANPTPATEKTEQNEKKEQDEKKEPVNLSTRLGGTGRGKVIASADYSDPFASFLANAKNTRAPNNDRRNGNFAPRPRGQQGYNNQQGQFADAEGRPPRQQSRGPRPPRVEGENNNRPRTPRTQNVEEGAVKTEGDNRRPARTNDYNNADRNNNNNRPRDNNNRNNTDGPRKNNRKMNLSRPQQPQEVRTRRAVTFIDKDIDWASLGTMKETTTTTTTEEVKEDGELVLKEIQGDYQRYLNVGSEISWAQIIDGNQVGTLVGSNPTFDLSQKTAFLAAVSKATSGGVAARK